MRAALLLVLVLAGCPSEQPSAPVATAMPGMTVPGMATALPGTALPTTAAVTALPQTALPTTAVAEEPEVPAFAVAEGMTEMGWRSVSKASTTGGTLRASAALSDSVVGVFRAHGTSFLVHLENRRARAVWLDTDVAPFAIFAEGRREIAVVYRRRATGRTLYLSRFKKRNLESLRDDPGGVEAIPCNAGLGAACVEYVDSDEVLVAASCTPPGGTPTHSYAVFDARMHKRSGGPLPAPPTCGGNIDGQSPMGRSVWGAFGYVGGRAGFRTSENGEVSAKADGNALILQRPGTSTDEPRGIDLDRAVRRALDDLESTVRRRARRMEVADLAAISKEFPTDVEMLTAWLLRLPEGEATTALRAAMTGAQRPSDEDLREHLCERDALEGAIRAVAAAGVVVPCEGVEAAPVDAGSRPSGRDPSPASADAGPRTAAPAAETAAPQTAAPETAAPQTAAPQTAAPETAAPPAKTVRPSTVKMKLRPIRRRRDAGS